MEALVNATSKAEPTKMDLIVAFKDPRLLWQDHWFAVVLEVGCALMLFLAFCHAKFRGSQATCMLVSAIAAVIGLEILPILPRPGYQLWWYHQGMVNVLKQRVPSYVITFYAVVHYLMYTITERMKLPVLTRSVVASIAAMLIYFPCLHLGPLYLLQFLHFDDPVFKDRLFDVPYLQSLTVMLLLFHTTHVFQQRYQSIDDQDRNVYNYLRCSISSGILSAFYTYVEQYLLYIFFRLTFKVNTGICLLAALVILGVLAKKEIEEYQFLSFTKSEFVETFKRKEWWILIVAFSFLTCVPLFISPANFKSNGQRLELGPCEVTHLVANTSPLEIERRRYVCVNDTDKLSFDFHCIPKEEATQENSRIEDHYTICGKDVKNPLSVSKILSIFSIVSLGLFYCMLSLSFDFNVKPPKIIEPSKKLE